MGIAERRPITGYEAQTSSGFGRRTARPDHSPQRMAVTRPTKASRLPHVETGMNQNLKSQV